MKKCVEVSDLLNKSTMTERKKRQEKIEMTGKQ